MNTSLKLIDLIGDYLIVRNLGNRDMFEIHVIKIDSNNPTVNIESETNSVNDFAGNEIFKWINQQTANISFKIVQTEKNSYNTIFRFETEKEYEAFKLALRYLS